MNSPQTKAATATGSLTVSIFGTHAKRIGLLRTAVGGFVMYLTIPLFVFLHLTIVVFMYRFLLAPLLRLPRLQASNYIILDRHRIAGLHWFDKMNCWFCGYANGIITLMNDELDKLAASDAKVPLWARPIVALYVAVNIFFLFLGIVFTTFVLAVISKALGLHRGSLRRIKLKLREDRYGYDYRPVYREVIIFYKMIAMVIAYNLEQIESTWCPLKHIEREGQVLPDHHKRFHARDEAREMRRILFETGTVSDKLPKR